ncbi:hypothetical protein [Gracilimonas sediminicola]|uniref:hypothetical protein n=1 Tax=Gracilimonas sediminicola TaxID=2952158 RepID=UPI0038D3CF49
MKSSSGYIYSEESSPGLGNMMLDPTLPTELNTAIQPVSSVSRIRPTISISPGPTSRIRRPILPRLPKIKRPKVIPVVRDLAKKPTATAQPTTTKSEPVATQKKPINKKMIALAGTGIVGAGILFKILR